MKILSFDVGIKNLSFCLLNKGVIEDWGILNICTDDICDHCNSKTGQRCDKSAKFRDKHNFKVCPAHKKLKQYSDIKFKGCPKKENHMLDQGKCIVDTLSNKGLFLCVDLVVIENQPALKNPTMKSIQMMLYSYFLINGISSDTSNIDGLQMINARNKLKAYTGPTVKCDITDRYKKTKFLGIEYCKYMIHESKQREEWIELFTTSKKKDDLADAYLQGMYVYNEK
jgi:hypothetical protein